HGKESPMTNTDHTKLLQACKKVRDILTDRQDSDEQDDHLLAVVNEAIAATTGNEPAGSIHDLLAQERKIAHIWGIGDVQDVRPDLSEDQAWQVLQTVEKYLDSDYGITWDTIKLTADELFGPAPETDEPEEA